MAKALVGGRCLLGLVASLAGVAGCVSEGLTVAFGATGSRSSPAVPEVAGHARAGAPRGPVLLAWQPFLKRVQPIACKVGGAWVSHGPECLDGFDTSEWVALLDGTHVEAQKRVTDVTFLRVPGDPDLAIWPADAKLRVTRASVDPSHVAAADLCAGKAAVLAHGPRRVEVTVQWIVAAQGGSGWLMGTRTVPSGWDGVCSAVSVMGGVAKVVSEESCTPDQSFVGAVDLDGDGAVAVLLRRGPQDLPVVRRFVDGSLTALPPPRPSQ